MKIFVALLAVSMATVVLGHHRFRYGSSYSRYYPRYRPSYGYWPSCSLSSLCQDVKDLKNRTNTLWTAAFNSTTCDGHTYYLSQTESLNNLRGQDVCQAMGGYLAEINTESEYRCVQSFVGPLMSRHTHILIGGSDAATEGTWVFDRPNPSTPGPYLDWATGQPDNAGNEDCLAFLPDGASSARMNDIFCNWGPGAWTGRLGYLCEVE